MVEIEFIRFYTGPKTATKTIGIRSGLWYAWLYGWKWQWSIYSFILFKITQLVFLKSLGSNRKNSLETSFYLTLKIIKKSLKFSQGFIWFLADEYDYERIRKVIKWLPFKLLNERPIECTFTINKVFSLSYSVRAASLLISFVLLISSSSRRASTDFKCLASEINSLKYFRNLSLITFYS